MDELDKQTCSAYGKILYVINHGNDPNKLWDTLKGIIQEAQLEEQIRCAALMADDPYWPHKLFTKPLRIQETISHVINENI